MDVVHLCLCIVTQTIVQFQHSIFCSAICFDDISANLEYICLGSSQSRWILVPDWSNVSEDLVPRFLLRREVLVSQAYQMDCTCAHCHSRETFDLLAWALLVFVFPVCSHSIINNNEKLTGIFYYWLLRNDYWADKISLIRFCALTPNIHLIVLQFCDKYMLCPIKNNMKNWHCGVLHLITWCWPFL